MAKNPRLQEINDYIVILGKLFRLKNIEEKDSLNEKIESTFRSIPWFTYRKNFKPVDKKL